MRPGLRLSLHTRSCCVSTGTLIVVGTAAIYTLEVPQPRRRSARCAQERAVLAASFQSVSARTAGFNTINLGAAYQPTLFLLMALMFIGASPGGTGGGVKTTTFRITVAALWSTVRGGEEPRNLRPAPAPPDARRALVLRLPHCLPGPERRRGPGAGVRIARPAVGALRDDVRVRHRGPLDGNAGERAEPLGTLRDAWKAAS